MRQIRRVIIHHSASSLSTTVSTIRKWHKAKGWKDIGYHYVVEGSGRLRYGRPVHEMGAHARGANLDTVGICVVGDNTRDDRQWNAAQLVTLRELLDALQLVFGVVEIYGHREVGTTKTECPGRGVWV